MIAAETNTAKGDCRDWLRRVLGLFVLALVAATWRMWTPQTVFPQVAWFQFLDNVPSGIEWVGFSLIVASGLVLLVAARHWHIETAALSTLAAALTVLILLDQQRFQPWAYQMVLISLALATLPGPQALGWLRLLTVSIYFYSAISKFDFSFLHTLGQEFLQSLLGWFGATTDRWPDWLRLAAAGMFPLGELAIAGGLALRPTRRVALVGVVVLHVSLLLILGPLGLNHRPSVLLWNIFLIALDLLLFAGRLQPAGVEVPARGKHQHSGQIARNFSRAVILAAVLLPPLAWWGWFDHWPAWGLYSPRAERIVVFVQRSAVERFPEELRRNCLPAHDADHKAEGDDWLQLKIDRWSLDVLHAPLYPQNRGQLAVAEAVARRFDLAARIRVLQLSSSHPWTGRRRQVTLDGQAELQAACDRSLLNGHANRRFLAAGP